MKLRETIIKYLVPWGFVFTFFAFITQYFIHFLCNIYYLESCGYQFRPHQVLFVPLSVFCWLMYAIMIYLWGRDNEA